MHTTETDGRDDLTAMAQARASARPSSTSPSPITARRSPWPTASTRQRALEHAARVRALNGRFENLTLLAGIECDILADGRLDLADDCLAQLDIVVASIHSNFSQEPQQMTDRILRAIECPWVDVLGHPTGRRLLQRDPLKFDMAAVMDAVSRHGLALEINCQVERLDLNDSHARAARERRNPARHLDRRAQRPGAVAPAVGGSGCPAGMGSARRCLEHPAGRRAARPPPAESERVRWRSPQPGSSR